ncbi:hypothetical protein L226DRAFT_612382 [Lentinus tigrinus ALCF2SS1-7]|uniref:CFEM domain-containing protein n=1 Tax=Lentinus tigrinus ALCF2SS1-6 TaxID=1328759 RepID=A0A5C2SEG5_9APHY|nr:hypothetical protein L227DRAFT_652348 [Lentinus tigrinus ALCF2SS1-6]RPD76154.1 hypothetical protein L226DRAFT_612382 [Lentinus tigrinus ALCF2SS1-7]
MRFFAVLALAAVASAASLNRRQLPSCANSCLANADFGSCDPLDDSCLCNNQGFVSSVTTCIESSCQGSDLQAAESAAQQLCLAVGVTLTATPSASATSSGSGSATSGASAGSTSATSTATSPASSSTQTQSGSSGSNGAATHGVNALAALAAVGAAAFVL